MKHRIVIVGGGFGGVKTALELADDHRFDVTLISDHDDFRNYPTLYHVSTGGAKRTASIPLTEIFAGKPVRVIIDTVVDVDKKARTVSTATKQIFSYEALVLALGV